MISLSTNNKWIAGVAYITVPENVDRDQYILDCFMTGTVSITSEAGGVINNIAISKSCLQQIEFPENEAFGSSVVYVLDEFNNKQIVVGVLQSEEENSNNEENEYVIKRRFKNSICEIRLNPNDEAISILISGDSPVIFIKNSKGIIEIESSVKKETYNTSYERCELSKQTLVGNLNKYSRIVQSDTEILVEIDKFVLTKEEEAFAQGNILKDFLDKFIETVGNSTVFTSIGEQPLVNKVDILKLKEETKNILSKYFFMKKNEDK